MAKRNLSKDLVIRILDKRGVPRKFTEQHIRCAYWHIFPDVLKDSNYLERIVNKLESDYQTEKRIQTVV